MHSISNPRNVVQARLYYFNSLHLFHRLAYHDAVPDSIGPIITAVVVRSATHL